MWRSEDNLWGLVFSCHDICAGDWQQVPLPAELSHRPRILSFYYVLIVGSAIIFFES